MSSHIVKMVKFFFGSAGGAILDLGVGSFLLASGLPLLAACCIGFFSAVVVTFVIHLRWTFVSHDQKIISARLVKFIIISFACLGVRLILLQLLERATGTTSFHVNVILLSAVLGISFIVNYTLSNFWVFINKK